MKETKILILNHFDTNKGDASILIGTIDALNQVIPMAKICVESSDSELTAQRIKFRAKIVKRQIERYKNRNPLVWGLKNTLWVLQSIIWAVLKRYKLDIKQLFNYEKKLVLKEYEEATVIISGGGGYIRDNSGVVGFLPLYSILLAVILRKPVMIYAQSIGPIDTVIYKSIAKFLLNNVDLITVRDVVSREVLRNLKVINPLIYITSDSAFFFHRNFQSSRGEALLEQEGIHKNNHRQLVGITIMHWHYPGDLNPKLKHENYKKILAEVSDYLIEKFSFSVVFISMNTKKQRENDINLAEEIIKMMVYKENAKIIKGEYSPEEVKDIISQMDLMIATRFHSIIFASTVGVPAISIMYEYKAIGIMKMLDLEKFVCHINKLTKEDLILKIEEVWSNKNTIRTNLENNVPTLQELALLNAKFLKQLIEYENKNEKKGKFSIKLSPKDDSILNLFN